MSKKVKRPTTPNVSGLAEQSEDEDVSPPKKSAGSAREKKIAGKEAADAVAQRLPRVAKSRAADNIAHVQKIRSRAREPLKKSNSSENIHEEEKKTVKSRSRKSRSVGPEDRVRQPAKKTKNGQAEKPAAKGAGKSKPKISEESDNAEEPMEETTVIQMPLIAKKAYAKPAKKKAAETKAEEIPKKDAPLKRNARPRVKRGEQEAPEDPTNDSTEVAKAAKPKRAGKANGKKIASVKEPEDAPKVAEEEAMEKPIEAEEEVMEEPKKAPRGGNATAKKPRGKKASPGADQEEVAEAVEILEVDSQEE